METFLTICVGVGLSAACGFRIFVPLLFVSVAAHSGHLVVGPGFEWIASKPAMITFGAATFFEVAAYYIPWVDHVLDTVATPAAIVAGTILTASMVGEVSPLLKWSLAVIAGGGVAGAIQAGTVLARGASTMTSGGIANPIFSTVELGGSVLTSGMAVFAPLLIVLAVPMGMGLLVWRWRKGGRRGHGAVRSAASPAAIGPDGSAADARPNPV